MITLKPAMRYQFKTGQRIGRRRDCFTSLGSIVPIDRMVNCVLPETAPEGHPRSRFASSDRFTCGCLRSFVRKYPILEGAWAEQLQGLLVVSKCGLFGGGIRA